MSKNKLLEDSWTVELGDSGIECGCEDPNVKREIKKCSMCDKPAGAAITGLEGSIFYCAEHMFGESNGAKFIYEPEKDKK
jgi:hypothetical protein